jgi:hypothetical protein
VRTHSCESVLGSIGSRHSICWTDIIGHHKDRKTNTTHLQDPPTYHRRLALHIKHHVRRLEHDRVGCCKYTHANTPSCTARAHKLIPHLQGVFTYLIESLGTKNVQFEELISLDPESLQQLNPIGVIFLFKYPTGEKPQKDKPLDGEFDFAAVEAQGEENVWFAAQTIQNACGTQALLSVLLNKDGSSEDGNVDIGPNLREFKEFTNGFPADVRWS